jgi:hypothetical protein
LAATATGGQVLIDDFDTGVIDPRWFTLDTNVQLDAGGIPIGPKPWGPGIFDASSGALNLRTTGPVPPNPALPPGPEIFDTPSSGLMGLGWTPSALDPSFSNGRLRATVRVDNPSNLSLILRGDPVTLSAYVFSALGSYGEFHFSRFDNGVIAYSTPIPGVSFTQGENWGMEFAAVGNEFSMKAWKLGDPEPGAPLLTATDDTYSAGVIAVTAAVSTNNIGVPTPVNATFDDIHFSAIPEPSSVVLAALGIAVFAGKLLTDHALRASHRAPFFTLHL